VPVTTVRLLEVVWERLCRSQWPGARLRSRCSSWYAFAAMGGGDRLGQQLFEVLRWAVEAKASCPQGHVLQKYTADAAAVNGVARCDACGRRGLPASAVCWACTECGYVKCSACHDRHAEMLPLAVADGARNVSEHGGWSSLHLACRLGLQNVTERLLDARADVECKDDVHGFTPMMVAATHGHAEICSILLQRKAEKGTRSKRGYTALDFAQLWQHSHLERLLQ